MLLLIMRAIGLKGLFLLLFGIVAVSAEFSTDFMTAKCNVNLGTRISGRLETSQSLTYDNKMDCFTTISVQQDRQILLHFKRFDVEPEIDGDCVDWLDIHDGPDTGSDKLNPSPLCGSHEMYFNYSSSDSSITLRFQTDNNAVFRGFEVVYTEFHWGLCDATDFQCNNSMCIDISSRCNEENECGDKSDDDDRCTLEELNQQEADQFPWGIVIGCTIGGLILIIIISIVAYKVYDYYYWKRWLERNHFTVNAKHHHVHLYQYPVTDKYNMYEVAKRGRRKPDVDPLFIGDLEGDDTGRFMDEFEH